jgi:hypothetical protein
MRSTWRVRRIDQVKRRFRRQTNIPPGDIPERQRVMGSTCEAGCKAIVRIQLAPCRSSTARRMKFVDVSPSREAHCVHNAARWQPLARRDRSFKRSNPGSQGMFRIEYSGSSQLVSSCNNSDLWRTYSENWTAIAGLPWDQSASIHRPRQPGICGRRSSQERR